MMRDQSHLSRLQRAVCVARGWSPGIAAALSDIKPQRTSWHIEPADTGRELFYTEGMEAHLVEERILDIAAAAAAVRTGCHDARTALARARHRAGLTWLPREPAESIVVHHLLLPIEFKLLDLGEGPPLPRVLKFIEEFDSHAPFVRAGFCLLWQGMVTLAAFQQNVAAAVESVYRRTAAHALQLNSPRAWATRVAVDVAHHVAAAGSGWDRSIPAGLFGDWGEYLVRDRALTYLEGFELPHRRVG